MLYTFYWLISDHNSKPMSIIFRANVKRDGGQS